ncbi:MAG: tRNA (adenosine(37)-N6)-threonylcarbamoyltransferase complex dimerization subunit type 1 TsaB [Pseudomonadota bacterium]
MNLLAIDTSSPACSVAISHAGVLHAVHREDDQKASRAVIAMIDELLAAAGLSPMHLSAIAIGSGPGSFTGVRLGISVAQGLGFALDKPLVPVSSLAAVAQRAFDESSANDVVVAQDARMNEVYVGHYRRGTDGLAQASIADALVAPAAVAVPRGAVLAGDAWERVAELKAHTAAIARVARWPYAVDVLQLATAAFARGETVAAENATARYLRDSVVR